MGVDAIIVDNDAIVCGLSNELLRAAGFSTLMLQESRRALQAVREHKPRAVLLDILMPGVDGLTLCRQIKSDPETRGTKVIIVSGKAFPAEKERARRYGADLFIEKPYDVDTFAQQVLSITGAPQGAAAGAQAPAPGPRAVEVRIWGHRAAQQPPVDGRAGLLTPCVSVSAGDRLFILDAGSGILPLGREILERGPRELWLLLTHFHAAHVEGLGLFPCLRASGNRVRIAGPNDPDKSLEACVRESLAASFSVDPEPVRAQIQLFALQEGSYDLEPGVRLSTLYTNHPGTTLGYRLELEGRMVAYCPDSEIYGEGATALQDYDEVLGRFCEGADLLIHDARYAPEDQRRDRGQGHSNSLDAALLAAAHGVRRLLLFHQDPSYSDDELQAMEEAARLALREKGSELVCRAAREGLAVAL